MIDTKRKSPNMSQKLACVVAILFEIPRDHLKAMTVEDILALVEWDHDPVPVAVALKLGWTPKQYNHPSNFRPRLGPDHWEKTAKEDVPKIRKSDRVEKAHAAFRSAILAKTEISKHDRPEERRPKQKLRSRSFQKRPAGHKYAWGKRPLRGS